MRAGFAPAGHTMCDRRTGPRTSFHHDGAVTCSACGTENPAGRRFCLECGSPLAVGCPACGGPNPPNAKFCGDCGGPLAGAGSGPGAVAELTAPSTPPVAERRLVSVLFADLVGFTTLSESRDAEEVRELLSRYFETCRKLIERYGGTVEKFIGDAVMAVWGAPVAQEDDAERAVRAAIDLIDAVAALGAEVGAPDLSARAGRPHRRGRGHARGHRSGDGGRRSRQHRLPDPVRREAGPGPGRRGHAAGLRGLGGLRGRRRARAEGQGRARAAVARDPGGGGRGRSPEGRASRGPLRRPGARAPDDQGPAARRPSTRARPTSSRSWASPASASPVWRGSSASTSTACSRRSGGTGAGVFRTAKASRIGPSRRWSEPAPGSPRARTRRPRTRSSARPSRRRSRTRRSAAGWNPAWPSSLPSRTAWPPTGTTCSRPGACSTSAWRARCRRSCSSRTSSGPTPRSSTSSNTSWSGRRTTRCSW